MARKREVSFAQHNSMVCYSDNGIHDDYDENAGHGDAEDANVRFGNLSSSSYHMDDFNALNYTGNSCNFQGEAGQMSVDMLDAGNSDGVHYNEFVGEQHQESDNFDHTNHISNMSTRRPKSAPCKKLPPKYIPEDHERDAENNEEKSLNKERVSNVKGFNLSRPNLTHKKKMENLQKEIELKFKEECTFKPKINPYKPGSSRRKDGSCDDVATRLLHEADDKASKRERMKMEREMMEAKSFSFHPKINSSYLDMDNYKPPHERAAEIQRRKKEEIARLQIKKSIENPDLTFSPKINKGSKKLARKKFSESFQDRISQYIDQRYSKQDPKSSIQFKHKPTLNKNTEKIVKNLFSGETKDFLKRLEYYNEREQLKRDLSVGDTSQVYPFQPTISRTSKNIVQSKAARLGETEKERYERLSQKDQQKIELLKKCLEEQFYSKFKYNPSINPISKSIARPTDLDDLVTNDRTVRARQEIQEQLEQEFNEICTFKPQLISNQGVCKSSRFRIDPKNVSALSEKVAALRNEKEQKLYQARQIQQLEELKDCTFNPKTERKAPKQPAGPIIVNGLGKHLERTERAKKLKQDKMERENEAFKVKLPQHVKAGKYTIPEPFHLQSSERRLAKSFDNT